VAAAITGGRIEGGHEGGGEPTVGGVGVGGGGKAVTGGSGIPQSDHNEPMVEHIAVSCEVAHSCDCTTGRALGRPFLNKQRLLPHQQNYLFDICLRNKFIFDLFLIKC
jgi:hypothetical protein